MSKKLLMGKTEEYKGPIVYETKSVTDTQPTPSNSNYSMLEDEPVYFEGCYGTVTFNGNSEPFFLGSPNPDGTYTYTIKQTSVVNPNVSSTTTFILNEQMLYYNSTYKDRLYWDDANGCYVIQKKAEYAEFTEWTPDDKFEGFVSKIYSGGVVVGIPTDGYPNTDRSSQSIYNNPPVASNWEVDDVNSAFGAQKYAVGGLNFATADCLVIAIPGWTAAPSLSKLKNLFVNRPLYATFAAYYSLGEVTEAYELMTDVNKKIKLKNYKGGTTYSMVDTGGVARQISVSIPTMETKYLPYTATFEGTDVVLDLGENYTVDEDGGIYLEWFKANEERSAWNSNNWPLMGKQDDEYNYEYQIVVTPPNNSFTENVTFKLDYQIINYNLNAEAGRPRPIVEWNEESKCYIFKTSHNYLKLDSLYHPLIGHATLVSDLYSSYATVGFRFYNVPYMNHAIDGNTSVSKPPELFVNKYDSRGAQCAPADVGYYAYYGFVSHDTSNPTGFDIAVRSTATSQDRTWYTTVDTAEAALKERPLEIVYSYANYKTSQVVHNTILNKKVKLPYYGRGTKYSMQRVCETNGTLYKAPICISVPVKYDFKIAYKIFEGRDINVKPMEGRIIRYDQPGYLVEIKGDNHLFADNRTDNYDPVVKLSGIRTSYGQYLYNLRQTSASGKETIYPIIIPHMLCWWTHSNVVQDERPLPEYAYESTPQQDVLYWDGANKRYKILRRTAYYYADSAYGDIEFVPYTYSGYNIKAGAYEFLVEGQPNYNLGTSYAVRVHSSFVPMTLEYAGNATYAKYGSIFAVFYNTTFDNTINPYNIMGINTSAKTLDELDEFLRNRPLHVILSLYYYGDSNNIGKEPIFETNIRKRLEFKLSESDASNGVRFDITNGEITSPIKIAVPVTYTDIDIPTPDYDLGAPKEFLSGSNTYVNTNIQLFDTAKDFTILLDYQHKTTEGTYVVDNGVILHCRYESTATNYRRCGIAVASTTAPSAQIQCATDYSGCVLESPYILDVYEKNGYRYRIVIVYKSGLPHKVYQVSEDNILYEYELDADVPAFRAHTRPLYLGCQNSTSNSRSNYFKGTINECKVWNGTALSEGQILRVVGDGPYPEMTYSVQNQSFTGDQVQDLDTNQLNTNVYLFEKNKVDADFTIFIEFDGTLKGGSGTPRILCCTDKANGFQTFSICSDDRSETFIIKAFDYSSNQYFGLLKEPLPSNNKRYKFFVTYKGGKINSAIDLSSGELRGLELADSLPDIPDYNIDYYPILLGAAPFSSLTDTIDVWKGTIDRCIIWKNKALTYEQIEYLCKYILK